MYYIGTSESVTHVIVQTILHSCCVDRVKSSTWKYTKHREAVLDVLINTLMIESI